MRRLFLAGSCLDSWTLFGPVLRSHLSNYQICVSLNAYLHRGIHTVGENGLLS